MVFFSSAIFPEKKNGKKVLVITQVKKKDLKDCNNYRGITFVSWYLHLYWMHEGYVIGVWHTVQCNFRRSICKAGLVQQMPFLIYIG